MSPHSYDSVRSNPLPYGRSKARGARGLGIVLDSILHPNLTDSDVVNYDSTPSPPCMYVHVLRLHDKEAIWTVTIPSTLHNTVTEQRPGIGRAGCTWE